MSSPASPLVLLRRLWALCSPRRRWQLVALLALMLLSALAEVVSLGAVLPFIAALAAPGQLLANAWLARLAQQFALADGHRLLAAMTLLFVAAAVLAAAVRLLLSWCNYRFTAAFGTELAVAAYNRVLHQPYVEHTRQSSSRHISLITRKADVCIYTGVLFMLFLASACVLVVAVTIALLLINAPVALLCAGVMGGAYGLVSWRVHRRLRANSRIVTAAQDQTVRALQEGFGGIRDVLLDGTQDLYSAQYRRADFALRRAQGVSQFISTAPRYFMEALAMTLMAVVAWRLTLRNDGLAAALPSLAALALGAQRLLPAMQLAFNAWSAIVANAGSITDLLDLLERPVDADAGAHAAHDSGARLGFRDAIEFRDVSFRYADDSPDVLHAVNLNIRKGSRVGIVGASGAGKSTLTDLLMGLLDPTRGSVRVDGEPLTGRRRRAWQRTLAHVPQQIFLSEGSLAENIAFGVPAERIDMARVRDAARQAQLAEFIERSPRGYDTPVGERGVRLSGGQRQRIAIARALYKQAELLVLDEATNALDDATEQGIIGALDDIAPGVTVIIIAHRPGTIVACDALIELRAGRVVQRETV